MTYAADWISGFSSFEGETICWEVHIFTPRRRRRRSKKNPSPLHESHQIIFTRKQNQKMNVRLFPLKTRCIFSGCKCFSLSCLSGSFCFPNLDLVFKRGKKTNLHCFLFKRTQDDSIKTAFHCYKENVLQFRTKKPYLFDKAHRHFPLIRTLSNEIFRVLVLSFYCSK